MFMTPKKFISRKRGAAVIIMVFFFIVISLAIIQSATVGAVSELHTYRSIATSKFAYIAAEAGIEDIFYRTIMAKNVPVSETIVLNNATSTVTVNSPSATVKEIYATGNANNQIRKLYLMTTKNSGNAQFNYGAQIGEGGITMSNNVLIDGSGLAHGDIYSNGMIQGAPGVVITGNAISASGITADQTASSTGCFSDSQVGRDNPQIDYAQSFVMSATTSQPLAKISLYIKRQSNPTGATIHIVTDNGGRPSTVDLMKQTLDYTTVGTSYRWVDVVFSNPPILSPGTTYWIVFDATQSSNKYWYWCNNDDPNSPTTNLGLYITDWTIPTAFYWQIVPGTLAFKTYFGSGGTSQISSVTIRGNAKANQIYETTISGDAYYQVIFGGTVGGVSYPGSPTPPVVPLPFSSTTIAQWKSDARAGGVINGNCGSGGVDICNSNQFPLTLGPKVITGNLLMDNKQTLTLSGTVYVQGTVTMGNYSKIQCSQAYGANSCMLIADGYINVGNNMEFAGSGVAGSFVMLLSDKVGCNGDPGTFLPGCTTNNSAIEISNNATGALFYTTDSMIDISNNAIVTAVIGYKLNLANGTGIHYDGAVANLTFVPDSSTSVTPWGATNWSELK